MFKHHAAHARLAFTPRVFAPRIARSDQSGGYREAAVPGLASQTSRRASSRRREDLELGVGFCRAGWVHLRQRALGTRSLLLPKPQGIARNRQESAASPVVAS